MNRSILCNCNVEAESNFLLESLAACKGSETKTDLEMHFIINLAFVNYINGIMKSWVYQFHKIGQPGNKF